MRSYSLLFIALILGFFSSAVFAEGTVNAEIIQYCAYGCNADPIEAIRINRGAQTCTPADGTYCSYNSTQYWIGSSPGAANYGTWNWTFVKACPVNSTGTTTCICNTGYQPNAGATACELIPVSCTAGVVVSSGYFNVGTVYTDRVTRKVCKNGCAAEYSGTGVEYRLLVNGIYHYYHRGFYTSEAFACNGEPNLVAAALPELGAGSCAPGQSSITMGGITKCLNSDGSIANTSSASAVAAAQSLKDASAASAIQAASDSMAAAGGSASAVEMAKSVAAGVQAAGGVDGSSSSDPVLDSFCKQNPTASMCVEKDFGTVDDPSLINTSINVAINPIAVGGAGSCPAPTAMVLHGQTYYFNWTTYCNYANGIRPILLAFAWLSAAGLMVGGFKSA